MRQRVTAQRLQPTLPLVYLGCLLAVFIKWVPSFIGRSEAPGATGLWNQALVHMRPALPNGPLSSGLVVA